MSSPARRSGRFTKTEAKAGNDKNERCKKTAKLDTKTSVEEKTIGKQLFNSPTKVSGKTDNKEDGGTPVRRSGRASIPSSRFKDMEVMTPSRKRMNAEANDTDKDVEKPKKKIKKEKDETSSYEIPVQDSSETYHIDGSKPTVTTSEMELSEEPVPVLLVTNSKNSALTEKSTLSEEATILLETIRSSSNLTEQVNESIKEASKSTEDKTESTQSETKSTENVMKSIVSGSKLTENETKIVNVEEHIKSSNLNSEAFIRDETILQNKSNPTTANDEIKISDIEQNEKKISNEDDQKVGKGLLSTSTDEDNVTIESKQDDPLVSQSRSGISLEDLDVKDNFNLMSVENSEDDFAIRSEVKTLEENLVVDKVEGELIDQGENIIGKNDESIEIKVTEMNPDNDVNIHAEVEDVDVVTDSQIEKSTELDFTSTLEILNEKSISGERNSQFEVSNENVDQSFFELPKVSEQTVVINDGALNKIVSEDIHTEHIDGQLGSTVGENQLVIVQNEREISNNEHVGLDMIQEASSNNLSTLNLPTQSEHITLTQKDGKTIAILTLPQPKPEPGVKVVHLRNPRTDSLQQIVLPDHGNQTHHGYIVKETKNTPASSFATVVADDGSLFNLNVEAAKISNLLNEQEKDKKIVPKVQSHGRVLKRDAPNNYNVMIKSSPSHSSTQSQIVSPITKNQSYSLLNPPSISSRTKISESTDITTKLPNQIVNKIHGSIKISEPSSSQKQNVIICGPDIDKVNSGVSVNSQSIQVLDKESAVESGNPTVIRLNKVPNTSETDMSNNLAQQLNSAISNALHNQNQNTTSEIGIMKESSINSDNEKEEKENEKHMNLDSSADGNSTIPIESDSEHFGNISNDEKKNESKLLVPLESDENEKDFSISSISDHQLVTTDSQDILTDSAESDGEGEILVPSAPDMAVIKTEPSETEDGIDVHTGNINEIVPNLLAKGKLENVGKIKIVENGVEYEVKFVSNNMLDGNQEGETSKEEGNVIMKQEVEEEGISLNDVGLDQQDEDNDAKQQTSGTQTMYSTGEVLKRQVFTAAQGPIHKLATVEMKDGQKRQYYYVSVVPNKKFDVRFKSPTARTPACVVNEEGFYCCDKCNYKTERKANFYKHRRLHTGAKPHTCPVCDYKAGTSSNLKRHMGIHEDIRQHKCHICELSFRQKIHLERHIKYKHEEKRVKCPLCSYVCANEQPDLRMHIKRKHSSAASGEVSVCPECNAEFSSKKDLKQHMKFHKDGPELKLFCKECSFVTDCQSRLKRHSAIHEKVKPFMCSICQYRAAQKEHVLRHLRTQHKIEVKKETKRAWTRRKQPDKMYGQDLQGEVKERADFSSGDKIFACNHCTMRFAKLINLYKHLHTQHSDIMPAETEGNYYCVVCEFSTTSKKNLLVHMRRHNLTDQTPPTHVYSCVLCRYVNPKRRNLFQHMKKKHNIDISASEGVGEGDPDENSQIADSSLKSIKNELTVLTSEPRQTPNSVVVSSTDGHVKIIEESGTILNVTNLGNLSNGLSANSIDTTNLVIDTRGDMEQQSSGKIELETHSADAIEGLQALAEQAGLLNSVVEEQVSTEMPDNQQTVLLEPQSMESSETMPIDGETITINSALPSGSIMISGDSMISETPAEAVEEMVVEEQETSSVELTEEQLSSLSSGDMVEMDGELYLVDMTPDPSGEDKQLLSFIPINNTNVVTNT